MYARFPTLQYSITIKIHPSSYSIYAYLRKCGSVSLYSDVAGPPSTKSIAWGICAGLASSESFFCSCIWQKIVRSRRWWSQFWIPNKPVQIHPCQASWPGWGYFCEGLPCNAWIADRQTFSVYILIFSLTNILKINIFSVRGQMETSCKRNFIPFHCHLLSMCPSWNVTNPKYF